MPVVNLLLLHVNLQVLAEVTGGDKTWLEHEQLKLTPAVDAPMALEINRRTTTVFFNGQSSTAREVLATLFKGLKFKGSMNASGSTVSNLQLRQVLLLSRKLPQLQVDGKTEVAEWSIL